MLCTFGLATNYSTVFPVDGLCDFFFFDSAYRGGANKLSNLDSFQENLITFLSLVTLYKITEFGVAFSSEYVDEVERDLTRRDTVLISHFWQKGVYHFGMIDIPVVDRDASVLPPSFNALKALGKLAEKQKSLGRRSYVVMGAVILDVPKIREKMREVYQPDLFIGHGHYTFVDKTRLFCRMVPPTTTVRNFSQTWEYPYDLGTVVRDMHTMKKWEAKALWMISVTMKGRWATAAEAGTPKLGDPCLYNDHSGRFGSYREVCNHDVFSSNLQYDYKYDAMYVVTGSRIFSYDNEVSFGRKLCSVKAENAELRFGIAAYDLEYDDSYGNCVLQNVYNEGFSRLRALRRIVDYFKTFTSEDMQSGCLKLFP